MLKVKDRKFYIVSFAVPIAVMLAAYMANGILTQWSILTNDLNSQYVNFLLYYRNHLAENGLFYSFSKGLGGNFFGIFTYYLASPLNLIVFLFPTAEIETAITVLMLIRFGLASVTFSWFVQKAVKNCSGWIATIFGIVYALSSYIAVISYHIIWADAFFMLPVVMGFMLDIYDGKSAGHFVAAFSLLIISNYYMAYMVGVFCALMFVHRCICGMEPEKAKKVFADLAKSAVLSIMLTAWVLVPSAFALMQGKTAVPDDRLFAFGLSEVIPKLFIGAYDSLGNISAPFVYCGAASFALFTGILFINKKSVREKIADIFVAAVFAFSFWLVPLGKVWHMFSATNSFPYRFTYIFVFFVLWKCAEVFVNMEKPQLRTFAAFAGAVLALVCAAGVVLCKVSILKAAAVYIIGFAVFVLYIIWKITDKKIALLLAALVMTGDMALNAYMVIGDNYDALLRQPKGSIVKAYNLVEAELAQLNRDGFYRIYNKNNDYEGIDYTENSNFRHGFNDVTRTFTSLSEKEFESLRYGKFGENPRELIMAVTAAEYYLSKQQITPFETEVFPLIYKTEQKPTEETDLAVYIRQVTGCSVLNTEGKTDYDALGTAALKARQNSGSITFDGEGKIRAVMDSDSDGQFVATSIVYDEGWKIKVNGEKVPNERVLGHLTGFTVNSGENIIEMTYIPKGFYPAVALSVFTLVCCIVYCIYKKKNR